MAKAIMVQGTTSNAGKSLLVAGLCRILKQDGLRVAPFKSQNMALNSFVTKDGLEMGRAQVMQAECAGIEPDVRMNPILLKPNSDTGSQVIVGGEVVGNMKATEYFAYKSSLIPEIKRAYESLASQYDVIVLEGAGSPAEINLKHDDIVNMGMARIAQAPVVLVGDINPGGVFAALAGTVQLLEPDERDMLKGVVINKFRGDRGILEPGLRQLEQILSKPILGVVPYLQIDVDDEDSLSQRLETSGSSQGLVDIVVIRLPHLSNFTDFTPLDMMQGVQVRYVGAAEQLGEPDFIILPGTKNTMGDLLWLRQCGLETRIMAHAAAGKPVMGICGGYQMLGTVLHDPDNLEYGGTMSGFGLLEMETCFEPQKQRRQVSGTIAQLPGIFSGLSGQDFYGYEIHIGISKALDDTAVFSRISPQNDCLRADGFCSGNVYGTYVHGIFDAAGVSQKLVQALLQKKGLDISSIEAIDANDYKEQQYDLLADALRDALDMQQIYTIIENGI